MLLRSELGYSLSFFVFLLSGPALVGAHDAPVHHKPKERLKHWMVGGVHQEKRKAAAPERGGRTAPEIGGATAPEIGGATAPEMGIATAPEMGGASSPEIQGGLAPAIGGAAAPFNWQNASSATEGIKKPGLAGNFLCSPQENMRATKADELGREGMTVNELCIMGMTKFGWACLLTIVAMVILILCVPLVLAISRRRPPGTSMISVCGSKPPLQFRPPTTVPSYSTMNPAGPSYASAQSQTLIAQAIEDPQSVLSKPVDFVGEPPSSKPIFQIDDDIRFP